MSDYQNNTQTDPIEELSRDERLVFDKDKQNELINASSQVEEDYNFRSEAFNHMFRFMEEIMGVLGYGTEKKEQLMQQMAFGLEALYLDKLIHSFDPAGQERFGVFRDPNTREGDITQDLVEELRIYIQEHVDAAEAARSYALASAVLTDTYINAFRSEANEEQNKIISDILLKLQDELDAIEVIISEPVE
ncbi:hypothetical protein KC717_04360 [Candidatus Dojkabacteria bacterium]|uniref:Uncharacterized protein n=1 Tax=Candidatus Dojkabacteria bacterium TaxID=2099670 RepID=A0A955RKJ4_9BACT|nr:hypothetical protein [Candidatus Dojkabacteria bacterium]